MSPILAIAIAICSLVGTAAGFAIGLIKFGMEITALKTSIGTEARAAKHDAINAVSDKITILDERKLSIDVYRAEAESLRFQLAAATRRLDALERKTGLDGSGPHHTDR